MPFLSRGNRGEAVRFLQQLLLCYGYPISFKAEYDSRTEAAVRAFQNANSLPVDGIVGRLTWRALGEVCMRPS